MSVVMVGEADICVGCYWWVKLIYVSVVTVSEADICVSCYGE